MYFRMKITMRIHALCFILGIILSATSIRAEEERLWQLHAVDIQAPYAPAPMANGCIGILPQKEPFAVEHVMLNHVFDAASPHVVSRVMRGINPFCLSMKIDNKKVDTSNISDWQQTIDMRRAVHQTSFQTLEKADVSYELCALRNLPYAGLIRVTVQACKDMLLEVRSGMGIPDDYSQSSIRHREMEAETDPNCRVLQEDYLKLINQIGSREATTRRFFVAFEYEQVGRRSSNEEADAIASLQTAARTAANYLKQCGNEVLTPENEDEFTVDVLYNILCRQESSDIPLPQRVQDVVSSYIAAGKDTDAIPCTEFFAPQTLDFTHAKYICVDGQYRSYLLIPSYGYKSQVAAGWLSLLVNAGDGIDIDLFLTRQPKERMVNKLGQQLRINRSKIKDASDTNYRL